MDLFFQTLAEWLGELAERRFGRLAGCFAVLVVTGLFVGVMWLAWRLLA
jgi:high-affinity Fe2+/Pb2+ permease